MIDKAHLQDKKVVFRFLNADFVYMGIVKHAEKDGFWIESSSLATELQRASAWKMVIGEIQTPVMFVPTSSLMYLIVSKE